MLRAAGALGEAAMAEAGWSGRSSSCSGDGERRRARLREPAAEPEEPPAGAVLSLSHFCRSPFLCFGDVRLGASRTLPLTLHNPNAEVAEVRVSRFPAPERGFSLSQRLFVLQVSACGLRVPPRRCRVSGGAQDASPPKKKIEQVLHGGVMPWARPRIPDTCSQRW